ncbi:hypothetical protein Tco_0312602 [Tanacetum coccineum]
MVRGIQKMVFSSQHPIGKSGSFGADDDGFIKVKKKKSGGINGGINNLKPVSVKPKNTYRPKVNESTIEVSPKTASSASKKNVSSSGNSSKTTSKKTASTSCNGTFSLGNSFKALNIDNPVIEEVDSGNKASTSSV